MQQWYLVGMHKLNSCGLCRGAMQSGQINAGQISWGLRRGLLRGRAGGGGWHKGLVENCFPLAAPTGFSPLNIPSLCGSERCLVLSTEPLDDLSCLTTLGSATTETGRCPAIEQVHPDTHAESMLS